MMLLLGKAHFVPQVHMHLEKNHNECSQILRMVDRKFTCCACRNCLLSYHRKNNIVLRNYNFKIILNFIFCKKILEDSINIATMVCVPK
jgi:hypothetical protein